MPRLDIDVQVLVDGTWYDGVLDAWRKEDGRWLGFVRYNVAPGMNYIDWVDQERIRRV